MAGPETDLASRKPASLMAGQSILREATPVHSMAVLVLGMHRTGTSLVTHLLSKLGCDLGEELVPPAPDNPKGYWENRQIVEAHDDFLHRIGRTWSDPLPLPDEAFRGNAAAAAQEQLLRILKGTFRDSALWAVKDPRMCRLLPLWHPFVETEGIEWRFLHVVRSPLAVARSLEARDGLSLEKSLLLWLRHTLESESFTRGRCRWWVRLEQLEANPVKETSRLSAWLESERSRWDGNIEQLVESVFDTTLIHHRPDAIAAAGVLDEFPWVAEVYAAVTQLSAGEQDSAHSALDRVRSELARADRMLIGHPLAWALERRNEQALRLSHEMQGFQRLLTAQRNEIDAQRREIDHLRTLIGHLVHNLEASGGDGEGALTTLADLGLSGQPASHANSSILTTPQRQYPTAREEERARKMPTVAPLGSPQSEAPEIAQGTAEAIGQMEAALGSVVNGLGTLEDRLMAVFKLHADRVVQKHIELLARSLDLISTMEGEIARRHDALQNADAEVAKVRQMRDALAIELKRSKEHVAHVEAEHKQKAGEVRTLEDTYHQLESYALSLRQLATAREQSAKELLEAQVQLEREREELKGLFDAAVSSNSWRLTEPLRRLRSALWPLWPKKTTTGDQNRQAGDA